MIYSMTGFAATSKELRCGLLNIELRSVNHRFLDLSLRLPEDLRALEPALRELLAGRLQRGKVECRVALNPLPTTARTLELNGELLAQLQALDTKVRAAWPEAAGLEVADILRWPGMLGNEALPLEELRTACQELLARVLDDFAATRGREGEKLKGLLLERVAAMEKLVADVAPRMPQLIAAFSEKLTARLREAMAGGDEERIRQEIVLFTNKIDIDEELGRLRTHLTEVRRILDRGGAVGKRLDFLMQELNREANTLGSKSVDVSSTQVSMELKLLIEQIREQIQNIE